MVNYDNCCLVCGLEKKKEELSRFLGLSILVCKICDELPHDQIIAGVQANKVIPQRVKQKYFNMINKTAVGKLLIKKVRKNLYKAKK